MILFSDFEKYFKFLVRIDLGTKGRKRIEMKPKQQNFKQKEGEKRAWCFQKVIRKKANSIFKNTWFYLNSKYNCFTV